MRHLLSYPCCSYVQVGEVNQQGIRQFLNLTVEERQQPAQQQCCAKVVRNKSYQWTKSDLFILIKVETRNTTAAQSN